MNAAHLHLVVNHLPILGSFFAIPLILLAMIRRKEPGTWYAATLVLLAAALSGPIAGKSGENAEETVEDLPGVSEAAIHQHEERAELAVPLAIVTGLLGAGVAAWTAKKGAVPAAGAALVLAADVITAGAMASVGLSGGAIRHSEVREDSLTGWNAPMATWEHEEEEEEEEEE